MGIIESAIFPQKVESKSSVLPIALHLITQCAIGITDDSLSTFWGKIADSIDSLRFSTRLQWSVENRLYFYDISNSRDTVLSTCYLRKVN